jgi:myo-inositol-1(or 4)-monophosphatase
LLVSGFAYDRRETQDNNYREFCYLTHLTQGVRRSGSAALDLTDVAIGRLDGYWERGICPWDIAAGIVIVEEAGGKITAYDQKPLNMESGRILATNGHIHDSVSQALIQTPTWEEWDN